MRVAINYTPALGQRTGIGQYVALLAQHLAPLVTVDHYADPSLHLKQWYNKAESVWKKLGFSATEGWGGGRVKGVARRGMQFLNRLRGNRALRTFEEQCDLFHEPNYLPPDIDCPLIATWHDLSAFDHPEWHPSDRISFFHGNADRALKRIQHFLVDSAFTQQRLMDRFSVPRERTSVVYLGIRPELAPLPRADVAEALKPLGLTPGYLLHVGTVEPRKNLLLLMRAYCALPESQRSRCPLLLVGGWGWRTDNIRRFYEEEARRRGVRHLGYVPDEAMKALYNGARALVFPTLYEGFGFPPLEMLACGGAVLASSTPAAAEVVGPHAHCIDPGDQAGWRDAMSRACRDDDWLDELRRGGVGYAKSFSWERCARETVAAYQQVVNKSKVAHSPALAA